MKSFSFKILYVSIFAPSILYVLTLPYLQLWFRNDLTRVLHQQLIQNDFELLQGKVSLYDEVNKNVVSILAKSRAARLGAETGVRITDAQENVIYPYYEHLLSPFIKGKVPEKKPGSLFDENGYIANQAAGKVEDYLEKYSEYIQGMNIVVSVNIPVTSWLGSGILLAYILSTVVFLYLYYQRSSLLEEKRIHDMEERFETEKRTVIDQVEHELQEARSRLSDIKTQEDVWIQEVERLEKEKASLEEELLVTIEQTEEQKEKIDTLEEKAVRHEAQKSRSVKEEQALSERFGKLYRNLEMDRKAVEDLVRLGDEKIKLQAEEMLKRLNDGDPGLKIRRKISGVEKCDAFELGFGSSGRIYYRQSETRRFRVLRIGTKASQSRDLAYLQGRAE